MGEPIRGIDPTGKSFLGSSLATIGAFAQNIAIVGTVATIGLSAASAGIYKYYFKANGIKGAIVGAQLGAALSVSFALGGGNTPKGWEQVSETVVSGLASGIIKLLVKSVEYGGVANPAWPVEKVIQDFYEGFSAGAYSKTFGDFLDLRTGLDNEFAEVGISLGFAVTNSFISQIPDLIDGRTSWSDVIKEVAYNAIPAWLQSTALNQALSKRIPNALLRNAVKTGLAGSYIYAADALAEMFSDTFGQARQN